MDLQKVFIFGDKHIT